VNLRRLLSALLPLATALAFGVLLLLSVNAPPHEALRLIFQGALGSKGGIASTLMAWVPLVLAAAGLVVTFAAGLWNIGIEGQIIIGAIAGALVARTVDAPSGVLLPLMILAGVAGGLLWGLLVGVLRVQGRVNEIFGGLGLDFVATGLVVYLVIGPWKRAGSASTSGTEGCSG
jgi:simple sugar transport system permease protein